MHLPRALLAISATAACTLVAGHPGHDPEAELAAQQALLQRVGLQDLSHCAGRARTGQRRRALAARAVEKRGLQQNKGKNKGTGTGASCLAFPPPPAECAVLC